MKAAERKVKLICINDKVHEPYEVEEDKMPEDEKCPYCGKYLDHIKPGKRKPDNKWKVGVTNHHTTKGEKNDKVSGTNGVSDTNRRVNDSKNVSTTGKTSTQNVSVTGKQGGTVNGNAPTQNVFLKGKQDPRKVTTAGNTTAQNISGKEATEGYLKNIIGMQEIKKQLKLMCDMWNMKQTKELFNPKAKRLSTIENRHFMITGSEKSGKTTLAKAISQLLYDLTIRKNKEIKVVPLVKFHEVMKKGDVEEVEKFLKPYLDYVIVFNDNFDSIFQQSDGTYAVDHRIVALLEMVMNKMCGKMTMIIEAGEKYGKEIYHACNRLKDECELLEIKKYNKDELLEIAKKMYADKYGHTLSNAAQMEVYRRIERESFDETYSQGRFLHELFEEAQEKQTKRIVDNQHNVKSNEEYFQLQGSDFAARPLDEERLKQLLGELNSMVGMEEVKRNIKDMVNTALLNRKRVENGEEPIGFEFMNMLFLGPPGTGKTTVADLVAKIYYCVGLLKKEKVVYVSKEDLESEYIGGTSQRTQAKINEAIGGILFIDEAYSLCCGKEEKGNNGKDIVNVLVKNIAIHRRDLVVIMAGYQEDMKKLLEMNEGLPSRFPNQIKFSNYSIDELTAIFYYKVKEEGLEIEPDLECLVRTLLKERSSDKVFGNARGVGNALSEVKKHMSERLMKELNATGRCGNRICESDIIPLIQEGYKEDSLEELLEELNSMIGLQGVKDTVRVMTEMIAGEQKAGAGNGKKAGVSSHNLLLLGNPGVGKTTVARLIGKIYQKLGILKYGNVFVECHARMDLVAGYVGQTALKVKEMIKKAEGGILFIDEAYALTDNESGGFGKEAIDSLCAEIDDRGGELVVIAAGYEDKMEQFIKSNEGMPRRFPNRIVFEDYSPQELVDIFKYQVRKKALIYENEFDKYLLEVFEEKIQDPYFGNAGGVRNYVDKVYKNVMSRIGKSKGAFTKEMLKITMQDLM